MKQNFSNLKSCCPESNFQQKQNLKKKFDFFIRFSGTKLFLCSLFIMLVFSSAGVKAQLLSFSPQTGPPGTTIIITGGTFNTTAANNIVYFGAVKAPVISVTSTSLTVTVPASASFEPISVLNTATHLTTYTSAPFIVTFPGGCKPQFAGNVDFGVGPGPTSVAVGDIDGDGKSDLAVANGNSTSVSVLRNISSVGAISFPFTVNFTTLTQQYAYPATVDLMDLDGDGKLDMIVANNLTQFTDPGPGSKISVFRNTSTTGTINSSSFASRQDFSSTAFPIMARFGDIDGDGKPDMITPGGAGNSWSGVSVYHNTSTPGSISFGARVIFALGVPTSSVSISDLDGDGKPDIASYNDIDGAVMVFRNTATPGVINSSSLAPNVNFTLTGGEGVFLSIADIDGDGKRDIVLPSSVFRNTSTVGVINSSSFAPQFFFQTSGTLGYVSGIGDVDGDGKPDIVNSYSQNGGLSVFRNASNVGAISFAAMVNFTGHVVFGETGIGDLDGDGKPELAIGSDINTVSVFRNTATPASLQTNVLGNGITIPNGSAIPNTTNLTDFGVVPSGTNVAHTFTLQNSSSDSLAVNGITMTGTNSASFIPGALTPPGKIAPGSSATLTITFASSEAELKSATVNINSSINAGSICLLQQTYTFAVQGTSYNIPVISSFTPETGPVGISVTITGSSFNLLSSSNIVFFGAVRAVVTEASLTHLTVTVPAEANYQYISVTTLGNNLTCYSQLPFIVTFPACPPPKFAPRRNFPSEDGNRYVNSSDIDGDGKSDLVVSNFESNTVSVLRNTSTPDSISFAPKIDFATGFNPSPVSIGDYDGDGKPDIAVVNEGASTISVLRNTSSPGAISFAAKVDFGAYDLPVSLSTGDIDRDGKPDIVFANYGISHGTISILHNISSPGTINFASQIDFVSGPYTSFVSMGDIDGDGRSDLAVAEEFGISVMRNLSTPGSVNFAPGVSFATGTIVKCVNFGDIDGDGKLDLAAVNNNDNNASVLRNTSTVGTISFAPKVDLITPNQPAFVSISDIDGDGKPDLTTVTGSRISGFHNTSSPGSISFNSKVDFAIGFFNANSISAGDLNSDGKPDIAFNGANIEVLRNTTSLSHILANAEGNSVIIPDGSTDPSLENYTDFGYLGINENLIRTYTFNNIGADSISVDSIFFTGTNANLFDAGSISSSGKISPGGSATFSVSFTPGSIGLKTATVNITSNNSCIQAIYTFEVQGTGSSIISIKVIPQGYFNTSTETLNMRDTVRAYLMSDFSPFSVVDSAIALIDSVTFAGKFYFANAAKGEFYIKIRQRNTIETWSRPGGEAFVEGGVMAYNFTNELLKAYGHNMDQVNSTPDLYGIFSGDVNQDGVIDLDDIVLVYNDADEFVTGYVATDLTGQGSVDLTDVLLAYNNSSGFVSVISP